MGDAQTVAIGALGKAGGGGAFHARFADGQEVLRKAAPAQAGKHDPVEQARADAFAEGFDAGMRVATENFTTDQEVMMRLAQALEQVAPAANGMLSTLLSSAVIRLVSQIVGETPIDAELLAKRVGAVAAFIEEGQSRNSLHVNPDDIALLDGHDFGFPLTPDPSVGRGGVRLDTADGWIEDGPDTQLSRLKALLDDMEGKG